MAASGWKFWVRRHGRPLCFVVGIDDRDAAARRLAACEPFAEVLDVVRVPDKVAALLDLQPDQVTGWGAMPPDRRLASPAMTAADCAPVSASDGAKAETFESRKGTSL